MFIKKIQKYWGEIGNVLGLNLKAKFPLLVGINDKEHTETMGTSMKPLEVRITFNAL